MGFFPVTQVLTTAGGTLTGPLNTAGIVNTGTLTSTGAISTSALANISASGNLTSSLGVLDLSSVGKGLQVAEGGNAKQGTFTLTGVTSQAVPNTSVTANSRIFLSEQLAGGTPGLIGVASRIAGTSFTVSCVATDTSTYAYEIFEPG